MWLLFGAGVLTVIGLFAFIMVTPEPILQGKDLPTESKKLLGIQKGDYVTYDGKSFTVLYTIKLEHKGEYPWFRHLLEGEGDTRHWLFINERNDGLCAVSLWQERSYDGSTPTDRRSRIVVDGTEYLFGFYTPHHYAKMDGGTDTHTFIKYRGPQKSLISFESFGDGTWIVGQGQELRMDELTVQPGQSKDSQ